MSEDVMEDGLTRSRNPKPILAIGKDKVLIAIAVIGALFAIGIVVGQGEHKPKPIEDSNQLGKPGYRISTLPSSYADLPPPTVVPTTHPQLLEQDDSASKLDALLAKLAEERLRRAESAQRASVSFPNFSLPKEDSALGAMSAPAEHGSSATEQMNPRDEANRQDEKNGYLQKNHDSDVYLHHRIISQRSPYQLMTGTVIPGVMVTGLNSDLPGQILGQVSQNVFDSTSGRFLLVPQGTKVIGQYDSRIVYGQERVLIVWTRLIFPNGKSISLDGMPGVDLSGYAGVSDQVNNHFGRLLTGVIFSSVLSASAQIATGRNFSTVDPSYGELATQGLAKNTNDVGQEITRRNLQIQPTLEIRPGFRFNVFVHKDIVLEPYKES